MPCCFWFLLFFDLRRNSSYRIIWCEFWVLQICIFSVFRTFEKFDYRFFLFEGWPQKSISIFVILCLQQSIKRGWLFISVSENATACPMDANRYYFQHHKKNFQQSPEQTFASQILSPVSLLVLFWGSLIIALVGMEKVCLRIIIVYRQKAQTGERISIAIASSRCC